MERCGEKQVKERLKDIETALKSRRLVGHKTLGPSERSKFNCAVSALSDSNQASLKSSLIEEYRPSCRLADPRCSS